MTHEPEFLKSFLKESLLVFAAVAVNIGLLMHAQYTGWGKSKDGERLVRIVERSVDAYPSRLTLPRLVQINRR